MALSLLAICGSLRSESMNRKLLMEGARLFGPADLTVADLRLPLYDGDLEAAGMPEAVTLLIDQVKAADAVIIATPEYNQSLPGVLKNALDWVSRGKEPVWRGKPVAVVGAAAGRSGGARGQYALRLCMMPFRANVLPGPEVMVAGAQKAFDDKGQLVADSYVSILTELMGDLRAAAEG